MKTDLIRVNIDGLQPASVFQGVNRGIYEKGGVALTDAAMRAKATSQEATESTFELTTLRQGDVGCHRGVRSCGDYFYHF